MFRAWSYFLSLTKQFNDKHTIAFTVLGAPQWHHQRDDMGRFDDLNVGIFQKDQMGRRFNWNSGWNALNWLIDT